MASKDSLLVTGASGFIGHHLTLLLAREGYDVWAGVRASSSREGLEETGARLCVLDLDSPARLRDQLRRHKAEAGAWDYVVHAAGVTKALRREDFDRVNYGGTAALVSLLREEGMVPRRFVFLSSLSVYGPLHERDGLPFSSTADRPAPNTAYGRSKLRAEEFLRRLGEEFPSVILRPTGVYGPREKDYYLMARSVQRHVDVGAGLRPQVLTFVYADDVVQAVGRALTAQVPSASAYDLSDGGEYSSSDFSRLLRRELRSGFLLRLKLPLWLLRAASACAEGWSRIAGRPSTLNLDKYQIMKQRSWRCDIGPARRDLGYSPRYPLPLGVKKTVEWYKKEGWL